MTDKKQTTSKPEPVNEGIIPHRPPRRPQDYEKKGQVPWDPPKPPKPPDPKPEPPAKK